MKVDQNYPQKKTLSQFSVTTLCLCCERTSCFRVPVWFFPVSWVKDLTGVFISFPLTHFDWNTGRKDFSPTQGDFLWVLTCSQWWWPNGTYAKTMLKPLCAFKMEGGKRRIMPLGGEEQLKRDVGQWCLHLMAAVGGRCYGGGASRCANAF